MADDLYICGLDEASLRVAKEELNEDPKERLGQVEALRSWINQQKHFTAPTGTVTLLKYLRTAKFSQLRARELIENNTRVRSKYPEWLHDIDMADPDILEVIATGHMVVLPKRLPSGRLLLLSDAGAIDIDKKWSKEKMIRAMFGLGYYYLMDENAMVNGIEFFQDFTHFSMKLMTFWGMDTMKKTTKMWQGNFPGRFKGFHYFNPGPVFESLMTITKPLLKKKFQDRMIIHGKNMEDVYKAIPMEYFPLEYLPDDYKGPSQGSIKDICAKMIADLKTPAIRNRILEETSSKYSYDFSQKPEEVPAESFRKLNVD